MIFLNDLSLLSTALAAVATWRCCDLYWRPPLRSHHRQMVDDFLERPFVALHRLAAVATWRCCDLYWRPPLRSHHSQMVDDFLERSFVALHRLGGGGYLALRGLVLATTSS
jgi:hypothetical protein